MVRPTGGLTQDLLHLRISQRDRHTAIAAHRNTRPRATLPGEAMPVPSLIRLIGAAWSVCCRDRARAARPPRTSIYTGARCSCSCSASARAARYPDSSRRPEGRQHHQRPRQPPVIHLLKRRRKRLTQVRAPREKHRHAATASSRTHHGVYLRPRQFYGETRGVLIALRAICCWTRHRDFQAEKGRTARRDESEDRGPSTPRFAPLRRR
jgi:hypothetical protein